MSTSSCLLRTGLNLPPLNLLPSYVISMERRSENTLRTSYARPVLVHDSTPPFPRPYVCVSYCTTHDSFPTMLHFLSCSPAVYKYTIDHSLSGPLQPMFLDISPFALFCCFHFPIITSSSHNNCIHHRDTKHCNYEAAVMLYCNC